MRSPQALARDVHSGGSTACRRGVLAVIYLIFNEGYGQPDDYLAAEALRLARLLADLMPGEEALR